MALDERGTERFGLLVTLAGILLGGFVAFVLLFPSTLGAALVTISAIAVAIASLGFSTVFIVRQDALAASRVHDAEIVHRVERAARREQNLPIDEALAATSELWFSSWYRELARGRSPPMWLLLYSALGFTCATIVGIGWGLQLPWAIAFAVSGGLAYSAVILTQIDLRDLVGVLGDGYRQTIVRALLYRDIAPRWELTQTAIAYDSRLRSMAAALETRPGRQLRSLDNLLSVVSGQDWWMDSSVSRPRE
jgi:hypothetical protein